MDKKTVMKKRYNKKKDSKVPIIIDLKKTETEHQKLIWSTKMTFALIQVHYLHFLIEQLNRGLIIDI